MEMEIPKKSMFKLDEVCTLTGVRPYVVRFWESEFKQISPLTNSAGQKVYERKDIEAISLVKEMLFTEKMTIEKAKSVIEERINSSDQVEEEQNEDVVEVAKVEEKEVKEVVEVQVKQETSLEEEMLEIICELEHSSEVESKLEEITPKLEELTHKLHHLVDRIDQIQKDHRW